MREAAKLSALRPHVRCGFHVGIGVAIGGLVVGAPPESWRQALLYVFASGALAGLAHAALVQLSGRLARR